MSTGKRLQKERAVSADFTQANDSTETSPDQFGNSPISRPSQIISAETANI